MSDSVDRVFSHALNTVNKIRTGSQKPPSATRLKLYGLYKQAMEGDVEGIMEKPEGSGDEVHRAREKWDAWKQQENFSRTEAKSRYITTLIDTMHQYASPSPDTRELVAELEFVWDQVKSNIDSASHSSIYSPPRKPQLGGKGRAQNAERDEDRGSTLQIRSAERDEDRGSTLQIRSPMSQSEEEELEEQGDEFVDAPDSQYNADSIPAAYDAGVQATTLTPVPPEPYPNTKPNAPTPKPTPTTPAIESAADQKWRKRIEQSLVKMTADIAALREQLESRRLFSHSRKYTFFRFLFRLVWGGLKHVAINSILLGLLLLWMRRRQDPRLEGAIRVLFGNAVAQVQKVGGGGGGGKIPLIPAMMPALGGKKKSGASS